MVNQCPCIGKTFSIPDIAFNFLREASREIALEGNRGVRFSEISSDQAAIFCSFSQPGVVMVQVWDEAGFEFWKKTMDVLLIISKDMIVTSSSKPFFPASPPKRHIGRRYRKQHHNPDPRWYMRERD